MKTRKEFISEIVVSYVHGTGEVLRNPESVIDRAEELADALERREQAPWVLNATEKAFLEKPPEDIASPFQMLVGVSVSAPGAALCNVFKDLSTKFPANDALPPGDWEIGFRPAAVQGKLILPGVTKPN